MKSAASAPNPLRATHFIRTVPSLVHLPPEGAREVAMAGRSNAGKSSAINAICDQGKLARTSRTPGRTQALNYFEVLPERFLVDLPGYGYAKVPPAMKAHWQTFINNYFRQRQSLVGLIVVMDIRHPLRDYDRQMFDYAAARQLPAHGLLTKADKLGRGQQGNALQETRRELKKTYGESIGAQLFSAETQLGVDEVRGILARWLELDGVAAPSASD